MIEYALESGQGEKIQMISHTGIDGAYLLGEDTEGFGIAKPSVTLAAGAGVGARVVSSRVGEQDATLHIGVGHPDRHERERLLRNLASMIRYRPDRPLPRVTATYESGETLERAFVFRGGGSNIVDGQSDLSEILLEVTAPHPYWRSRTPIEVLAQISTASTLLPEFEKQRVGIASATGDIRVTNPGDVAVPMQWKFKGPSSGPTTITVDGRGFQFVDRLGVTESITVDVTTGGIIVTDNLGNDRFESLADSPEFPWLPEGGSQLMMKIEGASTASYVTGHAFPEYEVVHG